MALTVEISELAQRRLDRLAVPEFRRKALDLKIRLQLRRNPLLTGIRIPRDDGEFYRDHLDLPPRISFLYEIRGERLIIWSVAERPRGKPSL